MNYKKSHAFKNIGMLVGLLLAFIGIAIEIKFILYLAYVLIAVSGLQTIIFYKCPKCDKSLDMRVSIPKYCPECGARLKDEMF